MELFCHVSVRQMILNFDEYAKLLNNFSLFVMLRMLRRLILTGLPSQVEVGSDGLGRLSGVDCEHNGLNGAAGVWRSE